MNEVAKVLQEARSIISDRSRWTTRAFGRDASGTPTKRGGFDRDAVMFCAAGALQHVCGEISPTYSVARALLDDAAESLHPRARNIVVVNDLLGRTEALRCYDLAISMATEGDGKSESAPADPQDHAMDGKEEQ